MLKQLWDIVVAWVLLVVSSAYALMRTQHRATQRATQHTSRKTLTHKQVEIMDNLSKLFLYPTCMEVIKVYLHNKKATTTLLSLNLTCKDLYKLTQPIISEYFYLRVTGELPFKRNSLTSVILHHDSLPSKETLLLLPAIKHVHYMGELSENLLPPSVSILSLSSLSKTISISPELLPPQLTRLHLSCKFNSKVGTDNLPPTLTHIWFGRKFDQPVDDLPALITHLIFGVKFNQPVNKLPQGLIFMITGINFVQSNEDLPSTLQYLNLGRRYPHRISTLPHSLTHLYLQCGFNHESEVLPPKLQFLRLGTNLKYPLPLFPPTLTTVMLNPTRGEVTYPHGNFPNSIKDFECVGNSEFSLSQLPLQITKLSLWSNFSEPTQNLLRFESLTSLTFTYTFDLPIDGQLPASLTSLCFQGDFNQPVDNLPPNMLSLEFGNSFNQPIDNLPPKLLSLTIVGGEFSQEINSLPPNLQYLHLETYSLEVTSLDFIPPKLQTLYLSAGVAFFCVAEVDNLPATLTSLTLTTESGQEALTISGLPPNLEKLVLGGSYNPEELGPLLPPTLQHLELPFSYSGPLDSLPPSLRTLCIGVNYSHPLPPLPPSLRIFKQMTPNLKIDSKDFPPRLFHIRTPNSDYELPKTCHFQPNYESYACQWCDDLRSPCLDFSADDKHWKDAFSLGRIFSYDR